MSLLSGKIGIPDGAYTMLARSDIERAVEFVVKNYTELQDVVDTGGSGTGNVLWCRTNAAGTKIVGNGMTVSRTSEGVYAYTLTSSVSGENYGVVVTPSAEAGNGGDGATTFNAFDGHLVEDVGDGAAQDLYNPTDGKAYQMDPVTDEVWIHDLASFATDPTRVSMESQALSGYGCLDREGRLLWMGEDGAGTSRHLIAYDTTNGTVYDFGDLSTSTFGGWSWSVLAAEYNGGSPKLWIDILGSDGLKRYTPNLGTESLGAAAFSYTGFNHEYSQPATWDDSGTYWYAAQSQYLYRVLAAASSGNGLSQHSYPSAYVSPASTAGVGNQITVWDAFRKILYVPLANGPGSGGVVLRYVPASALANENGTWELMLNTASSTAPNLSIDNDAGVLMVQEGNYVHRYLISTMQLVDSVDVNALTSPTAGVPLTEARLCYYSHPYAYLSTHVSNDDKHVRLSYNGAEILSDTGGGFISSVLTAMYEITGDTTFKAYLFRSLSPIIRADGEHTVIVST